MDRGEALHVKYLPYTLNRTIFRNPIILHSILQKRFTPGWKISMSPDEAAHKAITLFDQSVDIGLIILTRNGFASNARNGMPWSHITESKL
jgi:hypothetical protein